MTLTFDPLTLKVCGRSDVGAMRTTPTAAMELIIGIVPLPVYIKSEAMAACYRIRLNSQWSQTIVGIL